MSSFAELVDTGKPEEVQRPGELGSVINNAEKINFVEDEKVLEFVHGSVFPALQMTLGNRSAMEDEWLAIQRMSELVHDGGQMYKGGSNAYLPVYASAENTQVTMLNQGLFPSDDFLDCWDRDRGQIDAAHAAKMYMQYELECSARLRAFIKQALKQFVGLGNCCLKYWYRKDLQPLKRGRGAPSPFGVQQGGMAEGLTVSVRSMFNVYVYPETAEGLRGMLWVAERVRINRMYIEEMIAKGRWKNGEEALGSSTVSWLGGQNVTSQTLQDKNSLASNNARMVDNPMLRMYDAFEVWAIMPLPKAAYAEGEKVGEPVSVRIVFIGSTPVYVGRNPYFHQMPPYLFGRQKVVPGVFYGSGAGRNGRYLQYLANDFANQTNDVGRWALNPLMITNPAFMNGALPPFRPGAIVKTRDINQALRFEKAPVDLIQYGQQMMSSMISMLQDGTGAPPVLQGLSAGRQGKTATGMQILQSNASGPLQDLVEDLEVQLMVPLMENAWALGVQYRDVEYMVRIAGQELMMVPRELDLNPEFKWLASSQAANKQVRAQQAMQFAQLAASMQQLLMMQGKTFDPTDVLHRLWTDGLGFRGFESVIKAAGPGMPGGPQQPGMAGQLETQDGGAVRSATEQAGGGQQVETQPGEGGEFQNVRAGADNMAAMQGASYGGGEE